MSRILTSITRSRGVVQAGGDLGASTRSTKDISGNPGALREAVKDEVGARALLVESSDLGLTVADSISNLGAEVAVDHSPEHNLDEVTGLALSPQLAARSIDEGEGTAVMVRRIVTTSHEDDGIGAGSVELGGSGSLSDGDGGDSAERESVADDGRHY
jgi:hypothetical protein